MNPRIFSEAGLLWLLALLAWAGTLLPAHAAPVAPPSVPAAPTCYVLGLSPYLDRESKDPVYRRILGFMVEDLPLGSSLRIYDAYHLQTVAELTIPELPAFKSAKTRANQFSDQVRALRKFLATEPPLPAGLEAAGPGLVRLPQFLDFLKQTRLPESGASVFVIGSPLYVDAREPSFSMTDGYFPSDGHLRVGRDRSVYGVSDRGKWKAPVGVHLVYFGDPWLNELHREKIGRFWQLFLAEQGAKLITFSGDLSTAFRNATQPPAGINACLETAELDPGQTKVEMLRLRREVGTEDWITSDRVTPATRPPTATRGPMKIGIRWQGDWDLDLYASARPGSETLFFRRTRCPEGYYYKDHRKSPDREYEFIEFTSPVDVYEVEALVNFYQGTGRGGAVGEVRVEFENKIYSGTFQIPAERGNQGRRDAAQDEYWTRLDVGELLRLRAGAG